MKAYYSINMTLLGVDYKNSSTIKHNIEEQINSLVSYSPRIILMPMQALGACHGPFVSMDKAKMMAASELDENNVDYFKNKWCFIECEMRDTYFESVPIPTRYWVCSNVSCEGFQRFKGSCALCKSKDLPLVPTKEIRDWDRRMR